MYIGFLTACLPKVSLEKKIEWAQEQGFKALELACWPRTNERDYSSSDIDVQNLTQEEADQIRKMADDAGITLTSIAYYDNNLDHDPEVRARINQHTMKCIDAAAMLGVETMGTFIGRNIDKDIVENMEEFQEVFTPIVSYAEEKGVKVVIENCPMHGWQRRTEPGTISYTPELFEEMFRRVPNANFGLNLDPSHLYFQLIDYVAVVEQFKDRIFHVHAKDAEIFQDKLSYYGVHNAQLPGSESYWRFRMPGHGQIDWEKFIEALRKVGYEGVISIEHEDPLYEGSDEKIYEGLQVGLEYLKDIVG